jgi:hypothetical protein
MQTIIINIIAENNAYFLNKMDFYEINNINNKKRCQTQRCV